MLSDKVLYKITNYDTTPRKEMIKIDAKDRITCIQTYKNNKDFIISCYSGEFKIIEF